MLRGQSVTEPWITGAGDVAEAGKASRLLSRAGGVLIEQLDLVAEAGAQPRVCPRSRAPSADA